MPGKPDSVPGWLAARAALTPQQPAYWQRTPPGDWTSISWGELHARVQTLAAHLLRLGLRGGDRVAIMMPTLPEWEYCHLAVLAAGGVAVGIDAHDAPENTRHILHTVRPRALCLAAGAQLESLTALMPEPPDIVVTLDAEHAPGVVSLHRLLEDTPDPAPSLPAVSPEQMATIVFTSGSTGQPKGIAYTHGQLCLAAEAILNRFPSIREDARLACWLPLSNLFQRIINLCALQRGTQSYFVDSPADIVKRLPEIRPALFIGVPRFYEKLHAGIEAEIARQSWLARQAVRVAWRIGERFRRTQRAGRSPAVWSVAAHALADRLVLRKLRHLMGPDLKFMVSGSAPMPPWLLEKLHGLGWRVLEAYGISECVVPIANNTLEACRFGSVGRPLPDNELMLAEDGEVRVRGPGVFAGYYGQADGDTPLDADGYLHTGDLARFDEDGFLWLTGRKSEVFKTSTGRRIAPVPIESALRQLPYVEHAVVFGRNRPVAVVLLSVAPQSGDFAAPLSGETLRRIADDIAAACAPFPAYQRPAGALVSLRGFSIAAGELTSNLKLRRNAIEALKKHELDALYAQLTQSTDHSRCLIQEIA
ncbi:MAG: AMP-binding protein [Thiobacillus sp.]|nr:AMP-binding protein [Thiobacillus sp.]